jgi:hypothetical protein
MSAGRVTIAELARHWQLSDTERRSMYKRGHNRYTYTRDSDGATVHGLWYTRIATFLPDGHALIDCGGWWNHQLTQTALRELQIYYPASGYHPGMIRTPSRHYLYPAGAFPFAPHDPEENAE